MRLVQAVTQATDADFKALTKTAQRLGRDTSYTAQQAADAMVSLGRMGFSPTEIQASIDAVLNLARSTGTELAEAGDIAANSMRIFGIEASQMSDIADVLTVTANSSAQTLIDLFEALKMGGPQAAAAAPPGSRFGKPVRRSQFLRTWASKDLSPERLCARVHSLPR